MSAHPPLCICFACMQRRLTVAEEEAARWKKGVEDANKIAQRFEAENVKLRGEYRRGVEDAARVADEWAGLLGGMNDNAWGSTARECIRIANRIRALAPPATEGAPATKEGT